MTSPSRRRTRPPASLCSSTSRAVHGCLLTRSWSSTSARTRSPVICPRPSPPHQQLPPAILLHNKQLRLAVSTQVHFLESDTKREDPENPPFSFARLNLLAFPASNNQLPLDSFPALCQSKGLRMDVI